MSNTTNRFVISGLKGRPNSTSGWCTRAVGSLQHGAESIWPNGSLRTSASQRNVVLAADHPRPFRACSIFIEKSLDPPRFRRPDKGEKLGDLAGADPRDGSVPLPDARFVLRWSVFGEGGGSLYSKQCLDVARALPLAEIRLCRLKTRASHWALLCTRF